MKACKHTTVYVVCDADLGDPDSDRCYWECIHCGATGTEFEGADAFDLATAEAEMEGRKLS